MVVSFAVQKWNWCGGRGLLLGGDDATDRRGLDEALSITSRFSGAGAGSGEIARRARSQVGLHVMDRIK